MTVNTSKFKDITIKVKRSIHVTFSQLFVCGIVINVALNRDDIGKVIIIISVSK